MIDDYIAGFDGETHKRLLEMYSIIKAKLPKAKQKISYGVPTFYNDNGFIVYFAGYKNFVSLYPVHMAAVTDGIEKEIKPYLSGKSTARFSHSQPLPRELIDKIIIALEMSNQNRKKK